MSDESKDHPAGAMLMNEQDTVLEGLIDILNRPEETIVPLLYETKKNKNKKSREKKNAQEEEEEEAAVAVQQQLIHLSASLFGQIESLAQDYHNLSESRIEKSDANNDDVNSNTVSLLSGLTELYIPEQLNATTTEDPETLWGQVELQNRALVKLCKKSIKKLAKSPDEVVLLDMKRLEDASDENDGSSSVDDDDDDQQNSQQQSNEEEGERSETGSDMEDDDAEEMDDETRRVRDRMKRAMKDMDSVDEEEEDDEDDDSDAEDDDSDSSKIDAKEEDLVDPVVEQMKDGFFDLNDMEDFADEEEDYLPEEAYGQPEKKKSTLTDQRSFHQMQRDGDLLEQQEQQQSDEESDDEFDDFNAQMETTAKRKKYRDDKDIDALYQLYQPAADDSKEIDAAANMTAADFFGKPRTDLIARYKSNAPARRAEQGDGDDDSWGGYDFEGEDDAGWRDESMKNANDHPEEQTEEEEEHTSQEGNGKKPVGNSKHAKESEKLRKQTELMEKELLAEKPWQMTGETKSSSRPVNSLLEGTPEFEMTGKMAPTITVQHTADLEDIIKQRIVAEDWDDVVPRELPDIGWHKKRGELPDVSQEKSKLGLGELYEREYLKKAVGYDKDADERNTEEGKAKEAMKQLFANICSKLDGLSNYHFAPRPIADEAEARAITAPAVAMEEVLPLHVSGARGIAPEEVYATKRGREGILRGDDELDQTERKRLRSTKKSARRKARKEKLADQKLISRLQPGLGLNNPYEKRKMEEELATARSRGKVIQGERDTSGTKFGSSGTFFKRLQTEAQETIKGNVGGQDQTNERKRKPKSSALKL